MTKDGNKLQTEEKWYDVFYKKQKKTDKKGKTDKKNEGKSAPSKKLSRRDDIPPDLISRKPDAQVIAQSHMFAAKRLPKDAAAVLDSFDSIIQNIRPLNSRQFTELPVNIRMLSHQLTDEREDRRTGYMNSVEKLSAYVRYFSWWNLVRFTRIFANLPESAFKLEDGSVCLDIGSGPLTIVTALWLARPELRNKKLVWYCLDISQSALALGEDIYLSAASRTPPSDENADPHWKIIRVKGSLGTVIKQKASFITCANVFNELTQKSEENPQALSEKHTEMLLSYAESKTSVFIAEPGIPTAAHFVSLIRGVLIGRKFTVSAPCPHGNSCPMNGLHARIGGKAKWCNFAFTTEDAPVNLKKLSAAAGIPKERAVVSFILASNAESHHAAENKEAGGTDSGAKGTLSLRIASDPIWLPGNRTGFYACSSAGLTLAVNVSGKEIKSGDLIKLSMHTDMNSLIKDKKSRATQINF